MGCGHQTWTMAAPRGEESRAFLYMRYGVVITMWSGKFAISLYYQLQLSYDHQLWTAVTPSEGESSNRRGLLKDSIEISSNRQMQLSLSQIWNKKLEIYSENERHKTVRWVTLRTETAK